MDGWWLLVGRLSHPLGVFGGKKNSKIAGCFAKKRNKHEGIFGIIYIKRYHHSGFKPFLAPSRAKGYKPPQKEETAKPKPAPAPVLGQAWQPAQCVPLKEMKLENILFFCVPGTWGDGFRHWAPLFATSWMIV